MNMRKYYDEFCFTQSSDRRSGTSPNQTNFHTHFQSLQKARQVRCSRAVLRLGVRIVCQMLRFFRPKTSGINRGLRSSGVEIESLIEVGEGMEDERYRTS